MATLTTSHSATWSARRNIWSSWAEIVELIALKFLRVWENKQVSLPERKCPTPPPHSNTNKHSAQSFIVSHPWPLCIHFGRPHLAGQSGLDVLCVQPEAVCPPWLMDRSNGPPGLPEATSTPRGFNNPHSQQARLLFSPANWLALLDWLTVHTQVLKCPAAQLTLSCSQWDLQQCLL